VEIVRRAWDAWGRGDLDGVLALCTEDFIFGTEQNSKTKRQSGRFAADFAPV
jgi:ketosteroid isomerase-like protein